MLDGLTPCVLESLGDQKVDSQEFAKSNYIDELAKNAFKIKKCYGYGETLSSNSSMITGVNSKKLRSDVPSHPDSFYIYPTLAYYFKNAGFSTVFYRNFPLDGLRRYGPYKRFNTLASHGFDHVCLEDDSKVLLRESKIIKGRNDFFLLEKKEPTFIFIHDMGFHDHPLVLKNATKGGVLSAVLESAERVKNNLEYLNYNEKDDVLVFSSDHGMTLSPYDDLFYNKNISRTMIEHYWPKLIADFKLRTCFFIKGPNIECGEASGVFEIRDMFATVMDFMDIKHTSFGAISARRQTRSSALVSIFESPYERQYWKKLKNLSHSYFIFVQGSKKWVYRRLNKEKCYFFDLKLDPKESDLAVVNFYEFPLEFRKYLRRYFSISSLFLRFLYGYSPKHFIILTIKKFFSCIHKLYK